MIELDIIDELGDDAELLTKSDIWLATLESSLSQRLTILLQDLERIQKTVRIKQRLQQQNLVAVKRSIHSGELSDEIIEILPLPKAVRLIGYTDYRSQINIWAADGYDVQTV
jgi:hypothetical protein